MRSSVGCLLVFVSLAVGLTGCGSAGRSAVALRVDQPVALSDTPVTIVITGLAAHADVALRATTRDRSGTTYASLTSLQADGQGRIRLAGKQAMRVLWSMQPPTAGEFIYIPRGHTESVMLTASVQGHVVARGVLERRTIADGVHKQPLRPRTSGVYGEFFSPASTTERRPAVLVFGGSEGGLTTGEDAALLASHGYPALALAYFAEPGLPGNLSRIPLEYFARALRLLAGEPGVNRSKLVVFGTSRGSEAAQLLGVHYPQLVHAVVALVPSNHAICGIPRFTGQANVSCIGPAWTFRGQPIPYSTFATPTGPPAPIADQRINGPIFLDCGGLDQLWPSCPMATAIVAQLHAHHFAHHVTLLDYHSGGHGVGSLMPYLPSYNPLLDGDTPDPDQRARANGWPRLLSFLANL